MLSPGFIFVILISYTQEIFRLRENLQLFYVRKGPIMNKKEVLEIRRQFSPDNCAITRICGCYVDHEKEKKE